jgi:hypothetical protein
MAKMFYTMDETKTALGRTEDQIKQLAREGRLREFRDGAKLMFKADQVEHLKAELAGGSADIGLAAEESDAPIGLADSGLGSGSGLSLADSHVDSHSGSTAGGAAPATADDTALASDIGLSGSVSGVPSPSRTGSSASKSGSGVGSSHSSRSGIDVFQEDSEKQDPSAATSISAGLTPEQMNIESVGSGSGLLDLTRESDDTSLGAELLDEIAPGTSGVRRAAGESAISGSAIGAGMSEPSTTMARMPVPVEAPDPLAPAFGLAALGAAGVVLFAAFALVSGLAGNHPVILQKMGSSAEGGYSFIIVLLMAFALPVVLFVGGMVSGKMGRK